MGLIGTIAAVVGGVAAGAAGIASQRKSEKKAEKAAEQERERQRKLEDDLKKKEEGEGLEKQQADIAARKAQKKKAEAATGRGDTILTGSLGLTDEQDTSGQKTLLGI